MGNRAMIGERDRADRLEGEELRVPLTRGNGISLELLFPTDGRVRSRTVVSRSRARSTGKYPSWKMGRMLQFESPNERNAFVLLDADPTAKSFGEQALAVRYVLEDETHVHYPDVLVEWADGRRQLWEIKPAAQARRPEFVNRTRILQTALPHLGFEYRMLIAEELARQPRLSNAQTMLKHGRDPVSDEERERVRQILLKHPGVCWISATNGDLGSRGRAVLCRLTLEGELSFDIEQRLTPMTRFQFRTSLASYIR
jgi:hypothetical protein